jgi:nucleoside-diphosphate-sugar epimerase
MSLTLLTGSNGFLGKYILNENFEKLDIYTLNRHDSNYNYDLGQEIPQFLNDFKLVIHAAGKAHSFPTNDYEKNEFIQTNVYGTLNLLNGLSKNTIPEKFVFISSVSVYGLNQGEYINENTPLQAEDPYGRSKIEAEFIVKKWCEEHNVICTILRLPLVVGSNPPGNLGGMIRAIKKGYYFNIGGGNARKSMVLASDIAKNILKVAEVGGTYNLTDGIHPTFYDLSTRISKMLNKSFVPNLPKLLVKLLAYAGDLIGDSFPINSNKFLKITSTLTFDDSNARMAFGWKATPVLEGFKIQDDV